MPELPDLEVYKGNIFEGLKSKRLVDVDIYAPREVYATKEKLQDELVGRELLSVDRIGKELYFDFGDRKIITVHLMLNGVISIVQTEAERAIGSKVFAMRFENDTLVVSDRGGLCKVSYMPKASKVPDAFSDAFTLEYFLTSARKKPRGNIKMFLIDQNIIKNISHPLRPKPKANSLPIYSAVMAYHNTCVPPRITSAHFAP